MKKYKVFVKLYLTTLFVFVIFVLVTLILLMRTFEHNTYASIVDKQLSTNAIYGTALNQNTFSYKLELIKQVKPDVVALGSSRVMQFREETFNSSFVNAGGAMNSLMEGELFINEMLNNYKPRAIILGVDFWWFNSKNVVPKTFPYHQNTGDIVTFDKLKKSILYLLEKKITAKQLYRIVKGDLKNSYAAFDNLGFNALVSSTGYRKDGSYFYSKYLFGVAEHPDVQFKTTLSRIANSTDLFQHNNTLSKEGISALESVIKKITEHGIALVILIPPVSPTVYNELDVEQYLYINQFRKYIKNLSVESYDFHNPKKVSMDNCEYFDGFHGGDVVYEKILLTISDNPRSDFSFVNDNVAMASSRKNKGKVLSVYNSERYNFDEIDFLHLGCEK